MTTELVRQGVRAAGPTANDLHTRIVGQVERELIQRSLERTGGNKGQAARLLNLKRTTLVEKLKRLEKAGLGFIVP